jgi:uncharacterized membrane protein
MLGYDWPRLHAALNDLPTALLLVAVLFDLVALARRSPSLRAVGFWTLMAGAVGGVLAVISGLQAEDHIQHGEEVHRVMETHEKLALITLGTFAVLALWRIVRERRMENGERLASVVLSVAGLGVMFATAIYGGKLVFEHAAGVPSAVLQTELKERSEGHHHGAGEAEEHSHEPAAVPGSSAGQVDSAGAPAHTHTHPPGTPPHHD